MKNISFAPICPVEALPDGERLFLELNDVSIVLLNHKDEYYAIADLCTHDDGPLGDGEVEDHEIICPRHGARFDIRTGEVLSLPAIKDVPAYPTRVVDGMVEIGFES